MSNFPRKLFDSALGNIVRMGTLTRRALPQHCALCTAPAGNALICAVFSIPTNRYQGRLVWLAPFTVFIAVAG